MLRVPSRLSPLLLILVLAAQTAGAQEPAPPDMHATGLAHGVFHFGANIGSDLAAQASYPFQLAANRPGRFLFGTGVLLGLIMSDNASRAAIASPGFAHDYGLEKPAGWLSSTTSPSIAVPIAAGVGAMGLFGSPHERQTSIMLAEALITSSAWTGALKYLTGRERPRETTEIAADWTGPGASLTSEPINGRGLKSFPSGHTSSTWAIATVLAHQYPSHGIVPVVAYSVATAMGYSRMVVGAHWLSDVVVGGLIGYGCARQVIGAHDARATAPGGETHHWHLFLESDGDIRGGGLSYQF